MYKMFWTKFLKIISWITLIVGIIGAFCNQFNGVWDT